MKTRTRTGLVWLLALSLFISVAASASALSSRIRYYTAVADVNSMIPLVPEYVTGDELMTAAAAKAEHSAAPMAARSTQRRFSPVNVTYCAPVQDTLFTVSDDNTVWSTNTRVDIFKTEYRDGQNNIVVASGNGDKIIAPGTENSYSFMLKNNYEMPMDYTVTVKAYCTPDDVEIPVLCRLSRYDGEWLAGDEENWMSVSDFNGSGDTAQMAEYSYVTYTLDWQWPYEGNDMLDTALAQLANEEDVTLTIEIITTAEAEFAGGGGGIIIPTPDLSDPQPPEPGPPGIIMPEEPEPGAPGFPVEPEEPLPGTPGIGEPLPPKTGDESHPTLWIAMAAASFFLLIVLIFRKDEDEENTKAEAIKK